MRIQTIKTLRTCQLERDRTPVAICCLPQTGSLPQWFCMNHRAINIWPHCGMDIPDILIASLIPIVELIFNDSQGESIKVKCTSIHPHYGSRGGSKP